MAIEYQIKDEYGVVFGRFQSKEDRDNAMKFVKLGFPCEEEK